MYLAPEGEEIEIANAAADFFAHTMPIARLHGDTAADMPAPMRRQIAEMGWFALLLPEAHGGSGLSPVEHALVFREVGRQCGPMDVLAQCLAAVVTKDDPLLREVLNGEVGINLAVRDGDALRLLGSPTSAYALLVDDQATRFLAISQEAAEWRSSLDPATTVRVIPSSCTQVVAELPGSHIWRLGQLGTAAMLVGISEIALEMIVEYAKVRETFGRKIGSYQAVRHPAADMALRSEAARSQLWFAAAAMKEGRSDADVHLDAAKHLANQAAMLNADSNIQLHGGIGVTDEHNAHLLLKHALLLTRLFGTKRSLLSRLLDARLED